MRAEPPFAAAPQQPPLAAAYGFAPARKQTSGCGRSPRSPRLLSNPRLRRPTASLQRGSRPRDAGGAPVRRGSSATPACGGLRLRSSAEADLGMRAEPPFAAAPQQPPLAAAYGFA